jgi:hypothetical protein
MPRPAVMARMLISSEPYFSSSSLAAARMRSRVALRCSTVFLGRDMVGQAFQIGVKTHIIRHG